MEHNKLYLTTYNMHDFKCGTCMLDELCNKTSNIIAVQEHWLRADELDKFNIINTDFNYHAMSAMDIAVSRVITKSCRLG